MGPYDSCRYGRSSMVSGVVDTAAMLVQIPTTTVNKISRNFAHRGVPVLYGVHIAIRERHFKKLEKYLKQIG